MWKQKPFFRFEIDNFSENEAAMVSKVFVSGGYEWYISLHPNGEDGLSDDDLSLRLTATSSKSMGSGWTRIANFYFVLLNQSDKVLYRSYVREHTVFQADWLCWGFQETLPLSKFQEKGFLENDKLIVEVYIQMVESSDGYESEKEETVDVNGFQVLDSQYLDAWKIFFEHPDLAYNFKLKNQVVRTEYMNVLLNLVETLHKPSQNHSETELRNTESDLNELAGAGFKVDWLKSKLDEVSLQSKKACGDVQRLDERFMNLELNKLNFKLDCLKAEIDKLSSGRKTSDDDADDGSWVKEVEGRISNLEVMVIYLQQEK